MLEWRPWEERPGGEVRRAGEPFGRGPGRAGKEFGLFSEMGICCKVVHRAMRRFVVTGLDRRLCGEYAIEKPRRKQADF